MINQASEVTIGAVCIAQIGNRFFLLVEFETSTMEQVVIFRITSAQASSLLNRGIPLCEIVEEIPQPTPTTDVEFVCVFIVGNQAFLVFDVETEDTDELVLVRADICPIR